MEQLFLCSSSLNTLTITQRSKSWNTLTRLSCVLVHELTSLVQFCDGLAIKSSRLSVLACLETLIPSLFQLQPGPELLFLRHLFSSDQMRSKQQLATVEENNSELKAT